MMGVIWPDNVIEAAKTKNLIFVLGAGVSANSMNSDVKSPPLWKDLLLSMQAHVGLGEDNTINELFKSDNYIEMAEAISYVAQKHNSLPGLKKHICNSVDGTKANGGTFGLNALQEAILELNPKIIMTTNYDRILDRHLSPGYSPYSYYDEGIGYAIRNLEEVIIHLHGVTSHPQRIIVTQSDYNNLAHDAREMNGLIQSLFDTRVVLFVGYSVSDPDIRLMVQRSYSSFDWYMGGGRHHYVLTKNLSEYKRNFLTLV